MHYELECAPDVIARLPALLHEAGCDAVVAREYAVAREGISWTLMSCSTHGASAVVAVGTTQGNAQHVVNISMSLRRIVCFWRWRADFLLVREIARAVKAAGAVEVAE